MGRNINICGIILDKCINKHYILPINVHNNELRQPLSLYFSFFFNFSGIAYGPPHNIWQAICGPQT